MTGREELGRGIVRENPVGMLLLGLCPAAAVTTRLIDALWMSAGVFVVAVLTRFCVALLDRRGPGESMGETAGSSMRWLGALLVSAFLTASFELVLLAIAPEASASLGIYAPLIAVNCLVLGREGRIAPSGSAPGGASTVGRACLKAAGQGLGFCGCLILIALLRESLGSGTISLFPAAGSNGVIAIPTLVDHPARALLLAGGGLLCLGYLAAVGSMLRRDRDGKEREGEA